MANYTKKKYLITGAAGFIASNFVHYLYARHQDIAVTVLDKMTYAGHPMTIEELKQYPDFTFVKGDICDQAVVKEAMREANVVVNFAAESAVDRSIADPDSFLKTDVLGVFTLLQEARNLKGLKRFVQISTDEVYGQIMEGSFQETSELRPRNPYAASKLGGDRLAYSFYVTYGLPVIVTRASNNYGPRAFLEKLIPLFISNLLEGRQVPVYGEGKQVRDWLFVEDHCSGIDTVIEHGVSGEVYNIGGEQELENITMTRKLLKAVGKDESCIKYVQDRPGHDFRYSIDCAKLKALGWKQKYNVEEGLARTVAWYQKNPQWIAKAKEKMDSRYYTGFWGDK